jgi:hypothetical protein
LGPPGGSHDLPQRYHRTLIERWNGRAWTVIPSPNRQPSCGLLGIAGTAQHLWAVGDALTHSLILRH